MAETTIAIDVIDKVSKTRPIAIIGASQPCRNYNATALDVWQLIQIPDYWIYEAGTNKIINGENYYDYFPGEKPSPSGGVTPEEVENMISNRIDSTISTTSTNAIENGVMTNFVNSSIQTATADFKGTFTSKQAMDAVTANKNDYAFLIVYNQGEPQTVNHYERYKWVEPAVSGSNWAYEYDLNTSGFTAEQWAAINSGVKSEDVTSISDLETNAVKKSDVDDALSDTSVNPVQNKVISSILGYVNSSLEEVL